MKFVTLRLQAFGPFENLTLDLSRPGLHLIYGPNEAGKSSALRAIRQTLYGMDRLSRDAFRHPTAALRLGALLERSDGRMLEFVRRKSDKNALRQADDQGPLSEDALDEWLAGIDEEKFELMFGIDHPRLRKGGEEIVRGQGKLAETLFAAAGGVANLQKIQTDFSKGYETLYIPKGRNQLITQKRNELDKARKALQDQQLSSDEWRRCRDELSVLEEQREKLLATLMEQKQQSSRLTRYRTAFPILARWKQAQHHLTTVPTVPTLPVDSRARYEKHQQERELQRRRMLDAHAALKELATRLETTPEHTAVLAEAEAIEHLRDQFGSHRKALRDRPILISRQETALASVERQLRLLSDSNDTVNRVALRLTPDRKVRIQELGAEQQARLQFHQAAVASREQLARQRDELRAQPVACPPAADHSVLRKLVERVRSYGDVAAQIDELTAAMTASHDAITARLQRLTHWRGTLDEFASVATPTEETINRFEAELTELDAARKAELKQLKETDRNRNTVEDQLRLLESHGAIPAEADLHTARQQRDALWEKIDTAWTAGKKPPQSDREPFVVQMHAADEQADRLRSAAERVAQKAALITEQSRLMVKAAECTAHLQNIDQQRDRLQNLWCETWSMLPSPPGTPAEMRRWLQERVAILDDLVAVRLQQTQRDERLQLALRLKGELDTAMGLDEPSPTLAYALTQAEIRLDDSTRRQQQHEMWSAALVKAEQEWTAASQTADEAERQASAWRSAWQEVVAPLGLSAESSSAEAFAVLQSIEEVLQRQHDADELARRIRDIDRDAEHFAAAVQQVARRLGLERQDCGINEQMAVLLERFEAARTHRDRQQALQTEHDRQQELWEAARSAQTAAEAALDALCELAGGVPRTDLAETIERSERRRALQSEIATLEEQLVPLSAGIPLQEFAELVSAVDPDTLDGQLDALTVEQQQTEIRLSEVNQAIGTARAAWQAMQQRGSAAEQNELCQSLVADLQEITRQYAVLRLAAAVLQRGIERYRDRHQGPLLARASHLFSKLTAGSFSGLRSDTNDRAEPILVGVRADGRTTLEVSGMSDGACDQMYLALRLAGLEAWLDHHEPLPFIVDDVLLNFDDTRSAAALQVLGEFSRRTQVLFFTHHERLKELAVEHLPQEQLTVHALPASGPSPPFAGERVRVRGTSFDQQVF